MSGSKTTGTSWVVTGYHDGKQSVVSVLAGTTLTAEFGVAASEAMSAMLQAEDVLRKALEAKP